MDSYDSDSSMEDQDSGISTNVLLGYASKEPTDDTISQLGGEPSWLEPSESPSAAFAQCKSCSEYMALLLHLNGDLPERFPGHERRLYIWACRQKACRRKEGSVRALRGVKVSKTHQATSDSIGPASKSNGKNVETNQKQSAQKQNIGAALFGAKSSGSGTAGASAGRNPFSSSSTGSDSPTMNPFSTASAPPSSLAAKPPQRTESSASSHTTSDLSVTFAEKARITNDAHQLPIQKKEAVATPPHIPWPTSSLPKAYPHYHLDADYEYLSPTTSSQRHPTTMLDVDAAENSKSGDNNSKEDTTLYEDTHDKTFQHFADTLAQNPEQVLRYEFAGAPLLYSHADAVGRVFGHSQAAGGDKNANAKIATTSASSSKAKIPACPKCSAPRVFELQLTPHAIAELEAEEEAATLLGEGMEWGSVVLGVCAGDCYGSGREKRDAGEEGKESSGKTEYYEEWIGVQWEEVVARKR